MKSTKNLDGKSFRCYNFICIKKGAIQLALRVVTLTCDKYSWLIPPYSYLFNTYFSSMQPVIVAGYSPPAYGLPPNFSFHSIDRVDYPADRWSNGLIRVLENLPDSHFILMLDDYWICRTVDCSGIMTLYEYMLKHPEVLRMDLTTDRLYAGGMFDVESYGHYDIIETPPTAPYQFSTQAGIWNKTLLRSLLKPDKSGWDTEIQTSVPPEMRVLGTRQNPVKYLNVMYKGKFQHELLGKLPDEHRDFIAQRGWLQRAIG